MRGPLFCLLPLLVMALSGCGVDSQSAVVSAPGIRGTVIGGQQPMSGSTILLFAAGGGGYGTSSTAVSLGTVTTDATGSFSLPAYSCPSATSEMYLVARGGNPGLTGTVNNTASALMAVLGPCGLLSSSTHVTINELTTVAAVWALAPFMSSYSAVGSSSATGVGMANAFAMAATLVSSDTGQIPGAAATGAVLPLAELKTLGNVVASCVNTSGSTASGMPCATLFAATTVGTSVPTETVGAMLNVALHPATNVSGIYGLVNATGPFQASLTAAPNDWTVAMSVPLSGSYPAYTGENGMAIDASGNIWVQDGTLQEIGPTGAQVASYSTMAGTSVAIDAAQNVWTFTMAYSGNNVRKMPVSGGTVSSYAASGLSTNSPQATGLAVDAAANVWYTCTNCQAAGKLRSDGTYVATYPLTINRETNIAIDPSGNLWFGNITRGAVNVLTNTGGVYGASPFSCGSCADPDYVALDSGGNAWAPAYSGVAKFAPSGSYVYFSYVGGLNAGQGVAIDGASSAWIINSANNSNAYSGALTQLTSAGAAVSPALGYVSSTLSTPQALAIDGSGNVWVANTGASTLTVFVGAATPVVTPFAVGLVNGTLATRP